MPSSLPCSSHAPLASTPPPSSHTRTILACLSENFLICHLTLLLGDPSCRAEEVYRNCIGENEASINTLQMLMNIENMLEELLEVCEKMPREEVEEAEKVKEKQRRHRAREEKLETQRVHQEERMRRALERSQAAPKRHMGRKLVYRSAPPKEKKRETSTKATTSAEEEERRYYYT